MKNYEGMRDIVNMIQGEIDREAHFRRSLLCQYGMGGLGRWIHLDCWGGDNLALRFVHKADKRHRKVADCHNTNIQVVGSFVVEGAEWDETGRCYAELPEARVVRGLI